MKLYSSFLTMGLLIFTFVSSADVTKPSISTPIAQPLEKYDNTCGFTGNSDLYGLGIRLGVYFQWTSAVIMSIWHQEGGRELASAYISFVFALTIAIVVATLETQPVYTAEILLLTYIIFGGTFPMLNACILPQRVHSKSTQHVSIRSGVFLAATLIFFAAAVCCSWFWLYGHHHGFLETPCGTFGFLFARVSLYNPHVTKLFAALSIVTGVLCGCELLSGLLISIMLLLKVPLKVWLETSLQPSKILQGLETQLRRFEPLYQFYIFAPLAYSVIGVEFTIYWNSISGVYTIKTTSQLIPFIIGLTSLANIFYKPFVSWCQRYLGVNTSARDNDLELV